MSIIVINIQPSLSDPPQSSVLIPATNWIMDLIFGPLATSIAVIAVAWVGFAMLSGRVVIRHGFTVILGCFLLFGAREISDGLLSVAVYGGGDRIATVLPPPTYPVVSQPADNTNAFDPYAGAAVMRSSQ